MYNSFRNNAHQKWLKSSLHLPKGQGSDVWGKDLHVLFNFRDAVCQTQRELHGLCDVLKVEDQGELYTGLGRGGA